jgi:hypothetical protein
MNLPRRVGHGVDAVAAGVLEPKGPLITSVVG